jgi:uncharacterized membrane protein YkvA (DUF1232 family)
MEWWEILLVAVLSTLLVLVLSFLLLYKLASDRTKALAARIGALPLGAKVRLARYLMADERIPVAARLIPPLLVLYLSLPLDVVPDFIPVLGQLDDIVVLAVGVAFLIRLTPAKVLDEHLSVQETAYPAGRPEQPP